MLIRSSKNPILSARPDLPWASKKLYNCAVIEQAGVMTMIFRAIGDDWVSRLGIAHSNDGVQFVIENQPVFTPLEPWEVMGCEDPRITFIDGSYHMTYTAFDGITARAATASSPDLRTWGQRNLMFPGRHLQQREQLPLNWSKAAAIYPEKIDGKYRLLFGDDDIRAASSDDLVIWTVDKIVLSARPDHFDSGYVEMGPPPIKTGRGWLVLYHGIDRMDNERTYCLGAALFDLQKPHELLWRCTQPILIPTQPYEVQGLIDIVEGGFETLQSLSANDISKLARQHKLPRVVFCCGAVLDDQRIRLYYSGGDTVICTASVDIGTVFSS